MEKKKKVKDLKEPPDEKNTNINDDDDVTFLGNSHSDKVVKKVKLSLQKKDSGKKAVQTLLTPEINLNDTADFKDDNMEKYKSKFSKNSTAPEDKSDRKARSRITLKSNKHAKPGIKKKSATVSHAPSDSGSETTGSKYNEESQDENLELREGSSNKKHGTDGKSSELDDTKSKIKKGGVITKASPLVRHCPTCDCDMENEVFKAHIANCIDKFMYSMKERRKKAQEAIVAKKQWREKTREAAIMDEEVEEIVDASYQCQICQQDISDLNSMRRGLHVNKCIDQMENQGKLKKDEQRPTVVLDCPMCGKPLKTEAARRAHLKKCARALGVTTEQMMHVIKTQEKENQQKSSTVAGPQAPLKKTKTSESSKQSKRKVKGPQDEATQLAMALSSSMADEERKREHALIGQLNLRGISETTGQPIGKDGKKSRKKKNVETAPKPLLLQLSKAEAHNRITEKVTQVIVPQVNVEEIRSTPPPQESRLSDLPGTKLISYGDGMTKSTDMLWQKTTLLESDKAQYNKALYYCRALMPPVAMSSIVVGSKLRRLSEIPGRRKSGERRVSEREASQADLVSESTPTASQSTPVASQSSPFVASTQTAVVLAELAADEDVLEVGGNGADVVDTGSGTVVGQVDVNLRKVSVVEEQEEEDDMQEASGFCPEELIQIQDDTRTECLSTLQRDYLAMLDNCLYSDVVIATRNKCTVHAHQVILATRCPDLLKLNIDGVIPLPEASREAVMSLLQYVYAGQACLRPSYLQDIKDLADRFNILDLVILCEAAEKSQQNHVQEDVRDQPLDVESAERERRKSIDHLFQEMMTDDFNPQCKDDDGDMKKDSDDNSDEDDWREIYCSQRQQLQRHKSLEEMDTAAGGKQDGTGGEDGMELGDSSSGCEFVQLPCEEVEFGAHKKQPKFDQDELEGSFVFDKSESKDSSNSARDDNVFMQKETTETKRGMKHKDSDTSGKSGKTCVGKQAVQSRTNMDTYGHGSDRRDESRKQTVNSGSDNENNSSIGKNSSKRDSVRSKNISEKKFRKSSSERDVISNNADNKSLKSSRTSDSVASRKDSMKESVTRLDEGTCGEDELFSEEELELALSSMDTSDQGTDIHSRPQTSKSGSKSGKRRDSGDKSKSSHVTKKKKTNRIHTPDTDEFEIIKSGTSTSEEDMCLDDDVYESSEELLPPSPVVTSQAKSRESAKSSNKMGEALSREHVTSINKTAEAAKRKRPSSDKDASDSPIFHKSVSRNQQRIETPEAKSSRKRVKLSTPHQNSDVDPGRDPEKNKMSTPLDKSSSNRSRSVVEQDSLYITPIPKERQRSTFLLNTPSFDTQHNNPSGDSGAEYVATPVGKIVRNESGEEIIVGLSEAEKSSCVGVGTVGPISNIELQKLSKKSGSSDSDLGSIADGDDDRMSPIIQNTDVSHLSESVSQSVSALPIGGKSDMKDRGNSHAEEESKDSDSDIEITGDNLLSLSQMSASPKFKSMFSLKKVASAKKSGSRQDLSLRISSLSSSSRRESGGSAELSGRETSELKEHQAEVGVQDSPRCVADVWEGFDEMDAGCHLEPFCDADTEESPQKNNKSLLGSSQKKRYSHKRRVSYDGGSKCRSVESPGTPCRHSSGEINQPEDEDDTLPSPEGVNQGEVTVEFEMPDGDSLLWNDDNAPEDSNTNAECEQGRQPSQTDSFKTPVSRQPQKPMKKWVPPSPFTPIPDYDAMNTPQLKKEVSKFGVRPVGKKRMKILLKDIYKQTHQYETDSDYEPQNELSQGPASDPKSASSRTGPGPQSIANQGFKKPAKSDVLAAASRKTGVLSSTSDMSEDGGSRSVTSSQESGCSDVPEESFLMDEDDISASQQGTQTDLHTKLMQFLHRRQDIHIRMLMYEPVELDWLKKEIQEAGIKCSMQKLMDFLDEKCLTFTMKKMTKRNPNRRQPRKKKKVKVPPSAI